MKADENLVHFIKSHLDTVIQKGFGLFAGNMDKIFVLAKKRKLYLIDVPSQSNGGSYNVSLNVLKDNVEDDCNCKAFEKYEQCKHAVAAALFLLVDEFD